MNIKQGGWIAGWFILGTALLAHAAEPTLKIGDRAPALTTGRWVQGEPVKAFEPGKAYVVEFWATWCGPCRVSIPHLNELHIKYQDKGLVVIGQDAWETNDKLVEPFVQKMGDRMRYRVALDDKENHSGRMAQAWMKAAGQQGIPAAFVVDTRGHIAWIGHPLELKDRIIEQVLAGTYDREQAARDQAEAEARAKRLSDIYEAATAAIEAKRWDEATARLDEMTKEGNPDDLQVADMLRVSVLLGKDDFEGACKLMTRLSDAAPDDAGLQSQLAWMMVRDKAVRKPDLKLAETFALRASQAAGGEDADILDTLARVRFLQGNQPEAVALLRKAIANSDGESRAAYQNTLRHYEKGELPDRANELAGKAWAKGAAGQWREAADGFRTLIEMEPENHFHYVALQVLLIQLGDLRGYEGLRAEILKRFGGIDDPVVAERIAEGGLALPGAGAELESLAKLADTAVTRGREHTSLIDFQFGKALAAYRVGQPQAAIEWGQKVLDAGEESIREAQTCAVMAMAYQRLKKPDEARAALARSARLLAKQPALDGGKPGPWFYDLIIAHVLLREAKAVVEPGGKGAGASP